MSAPRETVTLAAGDVEATFAPEHGMVGVSLRDRGEELLDRQAGLSAYVRRGAVMGIPLLHPWANRLSAHDYSLDGHAVRLPAGPPLVHDDEHGLPIHGLLAASPYWRVDQLTSDRVRATHDFDAHPELLAAFPFPHVLELEAALTPGSLRIATTLCATGETPVPVAFGYHPYLKVPGRGPRRLACDPAGSTPSGRRCSRDPDRRGDRRTGRGVRAG